MRTHGKILLVVILPECVFLEEVLMRYYQQHACQTASVETARINLAKWSDYFAGALVSELTIAKQEAFVDSMRDKGLSNGYIQRIMTMGKAALNWSYKRQELRSAPYIITVKGGVPRKRVLTLNESAALLNAAHTEHLFVYLVLAFNTLSRPGAILDLQHFQVDRKNGLIHLNPPGREQTKKVRPVVPITKTLRPRLVPSGSSYVVSFRGGPVKSIKTAFRKARDAAGLGKDVIPYTIRHTMATELHKRGVPQWEIDGIMGHAGGGQGASRWYVHYNPDHYGKAVAAIDAYMEELKPLVSRLTTTNQTSADQGSAC